MHTSVANTTWDQRTAQQLLLYGLLWAAGLWQSAG